MKFFFTYGSDERFPFQNGWTEIDAPSFVLACAAFRHFHPDRDPEILSLNCADVYAEDDFKNNTLMCFRANDKDRCHEKITLSLTRELLDDERKA